MNHKRTKKFIQYTLIAAFAVFSLSACGQRVSLDVPEGRVEDSRSY